MSFIDSLREKSLHERKGIALISAGLVTLIIAFAWSLSLPSKISALQDESGGEAIGFLDEEDVATEALVKRALERGSVSVTSTNPPATDSSVERFFKKVSAFVSAFGGSVENKKTDSEMLP